MPKYVIRREVPGAHQMTDAELHGIAAKSNAVLRKLGTQVQWVQSYVATDRLYCIYNSDNEDLIREHARLGGFPCDDIRPVTAVIDPVTGED